MVNRPLRIALWLPLLAGGCVSIPAGVFACGAEGDCPSGQSCVGGVCVAATASLGSAASSGAATGSSLGASSGAPSSANASSNGSASVSATSGASSATSSTASSTGSTPTSSSTGVASSTGTLSAGASSSSGAASTSGCGMLPSPDAGTAVTVTPQSNLAFDPNWVTGVYQLGATTTPIAPGAIAVDDSDACDPQLYVIDAAGNRVLRYDTTSDSFSPSNTLGAYASHMVDIMTAPGPAGTAVLVSQDLAQRILVFDGVSANATVSEYAGPPTSPANFSPSGLATCGDTEASSTAILTIDNENVGNGDTGDAQALFFTGFQAPSVTSVPLVYQGQPIHKVFEGVTGIVGGTCASQSGPLLFAAKQADAGVPNDVDQIWWLNLNDSTGDVPALEGGVGCSAGLPTDAGGTSHNCLHTPTAIKLSAGNHLVWANTGNHTVAYALVDPQNGSFLDAPQILIEGRGAGTSLLAPDGLAFDANGSLYVSTSNAGESSPGAVYRLTLQPGF